MTDEPPAVLNPDRPPAADYPRLRLGSAGPVIVIVAIFVAATFAVPLLYWKKSAVIWGSSIAVFAGLPSFLGILTGKPSRRVTWTAVLLCLASPAIGAAVDPLPAEFEKLRDIVFLATSAVVIFVGSAWGVSYFRRCRWFAFSFAAFVVTVAITSLFIMVTLFMYLE